ncbi:uncharacterized protein B0J16DRAFT_418545 [Fusarium flagelliforme]|uniref:uncharacterized protein n=1 Tax=Fusarium flagelliforme TaxID=2675880 RepID=UPI001E8DE18F|nr:uncharacterized protein B0J16DRAFT_418545 [Fusarium flagelliforme]KAH7173202.1 hypothetical protein B0J16DRAFT_418545 [Fusarium flagelliforme]
MALQTTTSLLLPAYTGHFLAEIIGANTTATTFVLDCDNDKNDDDCGLTRDTVIVGPWGDKTPAPGAPTTGIWREAMTIDEEDWTFSTASHDAYLFEDFHFGSFTWVPVTVTKGQKFLSASQKTAAPKALEAEMATTSSDMPASSITGDVVILTGSNGKGDLVTLTGSNSRTTGGAGGDDIVTLTGEAMPSDTSDSGAFGVRITKLFAAVTIATVVLVCS